MRFAIDLGANVGQNLDYFIKTVDKVIAIEANPKLCYEIQDKFINEIQQNQLIVCNCAIVKHNSHEHKLGITKLYVPRDPSRSVLGSLVTPKNRASFQVIEVPAKSIVDIVKSHITNIEDFSYCKVDLEGYDDIVVQDLLENSLYPEVVSFELHSRRPLELIFEANIYKGFKVIEGSNVGKSLRWIEGSNRVNSKKNAKQEFAIHSSGPWGEDIPGPWLSRRAVSLYLFLTGTGWKDVHAIRTLSQKPRYFSVLYFKLGIKKSLARLWWKLQIRPRLRRFLK